MKYGFTGAQGGASPAVLFEEVMSIPWHPGDWCVTGACVGVDTQVLYLVKEKWPFVKHHVICPANKNKITPELLEVADQVTYMPANTDYRARNEKLVECSDSITGFWNGRQRSGTNMTLNIAKRANKIRRVVMI